MRYEVESKIWRQEHLTFFRWFINVPGKGVKTASKVTVKMSRHYWYADQWRDFEQRLSIACFKTPKTPPETLLSQKQNGRIM
jgi:hypothetical protein